jgi:signal transduction histidine kinase
MRHVLLIEDSLADAKLLCDMYHDATSRGLGYQVSHVSHVADGVKVLSKDTTIDLILADMTVSESHHQASLDLLLRTAGDIPVIFITQTNDIQFESLAMANGSQDYLVKGKIDADALARASHYAIERKLAENRVKVAVTKANDLSQTAALLRHQKDQLLELNNAKDDFISLSSHQLRTPATSVKQYLGMILEGYAGEIPEPLLVFVKTAYESNERQLDVINDLLITARLDSGRYRITKTPTDIVELLQAIADEYRPILNQHGQQLVMELPAVCIATLDGKELRLAIQNLLENANKYSPAGAKITISLLSQPKHIRLSVRDQGVGIARNNQNKIFDKFTRVENDLSDTVNGNGLGLYFVKRIIDLHDGSITIDSTVGQGTTFTIIIPR